MDLFEKVKSLFIYITLLTFLLIAVSKCHSAQRDIETLQIQERELQEENDQLLKQQENAQHSADSIRSVNDTLKSHIKAMVGAMPATERTRLNRRLLASLGLAQ